MVKIVKRRRIPKRRKKGSYAIRREERDKAKSSPAKASKKKEAGCETDRGLVWEKGAADIERGRSTGGKTLSERNS